jgi:hypothetical protein
VSDSAQAQFKEYATTVGQYRYGVADDPAVPEGGGWRLVGFAASDDRLFWAWERDVEGE